MRLCTFIMAAQYGRPLCFCHVVSSFFLSSFFAYSQRSHIGCLPYFHTCCDLTANSECMCEMCCTLLAENAGRKNRPKIATCAPFHNFVGLYLRNWGTYVSTIVKYLLNNNISSTYPHNKVNFRPLAAEIDWQVWGTPANFYGFRVLASLLQRRRSTEVNQTLQTMFGRLQGISPHSNINLCRCSDRREKF